MLKRFLRSIISFKNNMLENITATADADAKPAAEKASTASNGQGPPDVNSRLPKQLKYAVLLGYHGQNYFGMQLQRLEKEFPTVELHLLNAMIEHGFIKEEQKSDLLSWHFQRAARTDRAVSAVRQVCSMWLRVEQQLVQNGPNLLNSSLPKDIRVFAIKRVTPSFHAQKFCDGRTYSYTLPTFAFASCDQLTNDQYRITEERIAEVQELLNCFLGTHNYFNYTSKMEHQDARVKRLIINIKCDRPFLFKDPIRGSDVEFMSIYIHGQSFILHQIRKMIGMVITVLRGFCYKSDITRSFQEQRMDIPRAPGLGLLLERLHYNRFEKRFERTHGSLNDWGTEIERDILAWRDEIIMERILSEECRTNSMMMWLSTLPVHRFTLDPEDETGEKISELRNAASNVAFAINPAVNPEEMANGSEEEKEECDQPADDVGLREDKAEFDQIGDAKMKMEKRDEEEEPEQKRVKMGQILS